MRVSKLVQGLRIESFRFAAIFDGSRWGASSLCSPTLCFVVEPNSSRQNKLNSHKSLHFNGRCELLRC
jgi:hypothetical protein